MDKANYAPSVPMMSVSDVLRRVLNYVIEGGAVAVAAFVIPQKKMVAYEVIMIALTAAAVFAILDIFAPTVGVASRHGAGLGIGLGLVGFNGLQPINSGAMPIA